MTSRWQAWRERLRGQPRAAAGLALLVALGWTGLLLEGLDALEALRRETAQLQPQRQRLAALVQQTHWPQTREAFAQRLAELRQGAWRAESEGRLQAVVQDWMSERLQAAGLRPRELTVALSPVQEEGQPVALPAELRWVRIRVVGDFSAEALVALLAETTVGEHWLWVRRLVVLNHGRERRLELELGALGAIGVETGGGA